MRCRRPCRGRRGNHVTRTCLNSCLQYTPEVTPGEPGELQGCPKVPNSRPTVAPGAEIRPKFGPSWPNIGQTRHTLASVSEFWAKVGQPLPSFAHVSDNLGRTWASALGVIDRQLLGRFWTTPELAGFAGDNFPGVWRATFKQLCAFWRNPPPQGRRHRDSLGCRFGGSPMARPTLDQPEIRLTTGGQASHLGEHWRFWRRPFARKPMVRFRCRKVARILVPKSVRSAYVGPKT